MPPILVHEPAVEAPNGVRVDFHTQTAYVGGTVRYFRNGQLQLARLPRSGFVELGNGKVRLNTAPKTSDHVTFQYRPVS